MSLNKIYLEISRLFWKPMWDHPSLSKISHILSKPFENCSAAFDDEEINVSFNKDNKEWYHHELFYILDKKNLIEPSKKICIKGFRTLILESFSNTKESPSLIKYLIFRLTFKKKMKLDKAILFDGTLGLNYFHFFSDILNKIWLLEKLDLEVDIPLIIPKETFEKSYFQYFYNNTELKKKNWIVQDGNSWIEVNSLYLIKAFPYEKNYWKKTVSLINPIHTDSHKKIFLSRSKAAGRYLKNMDAIASVLKRYNFDIVETENMSFDNQVKTFERAEIIISIHGAGNTNIVFSDWEKVKFIEILPSNRLTAHYYWLTKSLGISYDVIKGGTLDENNAFELSPELLEKSIQKTNQ